MRNFDFMKMTTLLLGCSLLLPALVQAQGNEQLPNNIKQQRQAESIFDRGIGFMDAGEMKIIGVENFGLLCGWDPPNTDWYPGANHGVWGELRWIAPALCMPPGPWGAAQTNGPSLPEDRQDQYNSIESFSCIHLYEGDNYGFTDWEAKDDAATRYHGWLTEDNIPMIAISTLQDTWPQGYFDESDAWVYTPGEFHWPGGWALDPDPTSPTYGEEIPGRFVSSKDIFFAADDKYNGVREGATTARYGYPLGIDMEVAGYSYSSPLYEDVVFFNINFIYRTREQIEDPSSRFYDPNRHFYDGTIDSVYFSFFVDPDLPGAYTATNQQTHPWAEDDYGLVYDWDHDGTIDVFIAHDKQDFNVDEDRPQNSGPVSAYGINFFRTPRQNPSDPNSPEIGITGFHWFDQDVAMRPHTINADWEKVLYAISAGRPDLIPEEAHNWFHGDNPMIDDVDLLRDFQESFPAGSRPDIQFWFSSGPFSIAPGDTIPIHVGIAGGVPNPGGYDDEGFPTITDPEIRFADVFNNLAQADELYEHNFQGSGPPDPPTLSAVGTLQLDRERNPIIYGEDGQVTLYWNSHAEGSEDIITHDHDFEGYRIYKTILDARNTRELDWGEEIVDYDGNFLGYHPMAQYDLVNEWSGADPYNPWFHLGDDTGLQYSWIDRDVINGVHYRYSITSYDHPDIINSVGAQETTIGHDPKEMHIVEVVPGVQPEGWQSGSTDSLALHLNGLGTGEVRLTALDPLKMEDQAWWISFIDTSFDGVEALQLCVTDTLSLEKVVDAEENLIWSREEDAFAEPRPILNGVGFTVINDQRIEMLSQAWEVLQADTCDFVFSPLSPVDDLMLPCDYLVAFGDSSSKFTMDPLAVDVPFSVYNLCDDPELTSPVELYVRNPRAPWSSGDFVYLLEPDADHRTWQFAITWAPSAEYPPQAGDAYLYRSRKPFTASDTLLAVSHASEILESADPLAAVRVVPNPFIFGSGTELDTGGSYIRQELRFTHLPPLCTIHIYTLTGDLLKTIQHESDGIGEARWDLLTSEALDIAYGVYVYTVSTPKGDHRVSKFAVIR